jgi:hypothetical protein
MNIAFLKYNRDMKRKGISILYSEILKKEWYFFSN